MNPAYLKSELGRLREELVLVPLLSWSALHLLYSLLGGLDLERDLRHLLVQQLRTLRGQVSMLKIGGE